MKGGEPFDGFRACGLECVDAEIDACALVKRSQFAIPGVAKFLRAECIEPIRDGLTDGAGLVGEFGFARLNRLCCCACVAPPLREVEAHADPLGGAEGGGFIAPN